MPALGDAREREGQGGAPIIIAVPGLREAAWKENKTQRVTEAGPEIAEARISSSVSSREQLEVSARHRSGKI